MESFVTTNTNCDTATDCFALILVLIAGCSIIYLSYCLAEIIVDEAADLWHNRHDFFEFVWVFTKEYFVFISTCFKLRRHRSVSLNVDFVDLEMSCVEY